MSKISSFCGLLFALYGLPFLLAPVLFGGGMSQRPAQGLMVLLCYVLLTLAVAVIVKGLVLTGWALATRGSGAFSWSSPSDCESLMSWVTHRWSAYRDGQWREGFRVLGLNVALAGQGD